MCKLLLHTEEMMACQNSSGLGGRERAGGVLGWLFLFICSLKVLICSLVVYKEIPILSLLWP